MITPNRAAQGIIQDGICFECAVPAQHWHHVVPRALGGTKTLPLCEACHGKVHAHDFTNLGRLTRTALAVKKAKGERTGTIPYGYQLAADGKTLEAHEGEQAVVAVIRGLRAEGLALRAIAAELDARGLVSRSGGRWHLTQVVRVLAAA